MCSVLGWDDLWQTGLHACSMPLCLPQHCHDLGGAPQSCSFSSAVWLTPCRSRCTWLPLSYWPQVHLPCEERKGAFWGAVHLDFHPAVGQMSSTCCNDPKSGFSFNSRWLCQQGAGLCFILLVEKKTLKICVQKIQQLTSLSAKDWSIEIKIIPLNFRCSAKPAKQPWFPVQSTNKERLLVFLTHRLEMWGLHFACPLLRPRTAIPCPRGLSHYSCPLRLPRLSSCNAQILVAPGEGAFFLSAYKSTAEFSESILPPACSQWYR